MDTIKTSCWFLLLVLLMCLIGPKEKVSAESVQPVVIQADVSAYSLISSMNALRTSYGYPALIENSIIDSVAQATADYMAINQMSSHIGNVVGRISAAGYGGGATIFATENFAVGYNMTIDDIMSVWSDAMHMLPATTSYYCNVGAATAQSSNGMTYYILQAAYVAGGTCDNSSSSSSSTGSTTSNTPSVGSGIVYPVVVATPDADGRIYHVVKGGQSFWGIAIAYGVTIADIRTWNNFSASYQLQIGDVLFIPSSNTAGYFTPTAVDLVVLSTPDSDGKIVHIVQAYQTLSSIASAYGVSVDQIVALNGISTDSYLQIGQNLVIQESQVTPTPTQRPLTPLEKLTPASDGNYYHKVSSGEYLAYIANLYGINVYDLMDWNGLDDTSVLQVGEKLLLKVTPPATSSPTLAPATETPTATPVTPTSSPTLAPTDTPLPTATATQTSAETGGSSLLIPLTLGSVLVVMLGMTAWFYRRRGKHLIIRGKQIF
jgi:LysM repeat protein